MKDLLQMRNRNNADLMECAGIADISADLPYYEKFEVYAQKIKVQPFETAGPKSQGDAHAGMRCACKVILYLFIQRIGKRIHFTTKGVWYGWPVAPEVSALSAETPRVQSKARMSVSIRSSREQDPITNLWKRNGTTWNGREKLDSQIESDVELYLASSSRIRALKNKGRPYVVSTRWNEYGHLRK